MIKKVLSLVIIGFMIMCLTGCTGYMNEKEVTCTIQDKWIKRNNEEDIYLVQCDDEVYKITDLLFKGKFNSSDIYARLKKDKKYKLNISGYRWKFLSEYPNINEYELVGDE